MQIDYNDPATLPERDPDTGTAPTVNVTMSNGDEATGRWDGSQWWVDDADGNTKPAGTDPVAWV